MGIEIYYLNNEIVARPVSSFNCYSKAFTLYSNELFVKVQCGGCEKSFGVITIIDYIVNAHFDDLSVDERIAYINIYGPKTGMPANKEIIKYHLMPIASNGVISCPYCGKSLF
jgi:ribosomal protein S27E